MTAFRVRRRNGRERGRPRRVAGDKAYSCPRIRRWPAERGIEAVIPQRTDERRYAPAVRFDKKMYRRRSVVECCVNWLKECRAVGTRYDKLAVNYMATVKLAMIERYLRILASSDRP